MRRILRGAFTGAALLSGAVLGAGATASLRGEIVCWGGDDTDRASSHTNDPWAPPPGPHTRVSIADGWLVHEADSTAQADTFAAPETSDWFILRREQLVTASPAASMAPNAVTVRWLVSIWPFAIGLLACPALLAIGSGSGRRWRSHLRATQPPPLTIARRPSAPPRAAVPVRSRRDGGRRRRRRPLLTPPVIIGSAVCAHCGALFATSNLPADPPHCRACRPRAAATAR